MRFRFCVPCRSLVPRGDVWLNYFQRCSWNSSFCGLTSLTKARWQPNSISRNSFGSFMQNGKRMGASREPCFPSGDLKLRCRLFTRLNEHVRHRHFLIPQMTSKTFPKEQRRCGKKKNTKNPEFLLRSE